MLTVLDAAARLHKNPETVRRWIREGKLPARKVGLQYLVDPADLPDEGHRDDEGVLAPGWGRSKTGDPLPGVRAIVDAVRQSRRGH